MALGASWALWRQDMGRGKQERHLSRRGALPTGRRGSSELQQALQEPFSRAQG